MQQGLRSAHKNLLQFIASAIHVVQHAASALIRPRRHRIRPLTRTDLSNIKRTPSFPKDKSRSTRGIEIIKSLVPEISPSLNLAVDSLTNGSCTDQTIHRKPQKRALLIGCGYYDTPKPKTPEEDDGTLPYVWKDIRTTKQLLTKRGWRDDDIVILMDLPHETTSTQFDFLREKPVLPTKRNILKAFRKFVKDARPGDHLFLHMSGHGGQQPASDPYEKDGMDEFFYPCNYYNYFSSEKSKVRRKGRLLDNTIRRELIDPLPEGVEMVALIDCCNSGTMMDLPFEPERVTKTETKVEKIETEKEGGKGVPGFAKTVKSHAKRIITSPARRCTFPLIRCHKGSTKSLPRRANTLLDRFDMEEPASSEPALLPRFRSAQPTDQRNGRRIKSPPEDKRVIKAKVLSISSCHDGKRTFETSDGGSLVKNFALILNEGSHLTYGSLHDKLKESLFKEHESMKLQFQKRKEAQNQQSQAPVIEWDESWQAPIPQFCFSHNWDWDDGFSFFDLPGQTVGGPTLATTMSTSHTTATYSW